MLAVPQSSDWAQIDDLIEKLLKEGKRSQHEDFQMLFRVFGKEKIVDKAKVILERLKEKAE